MKIGFDAKRYFHNQTGLGNYSRNIIHALCEYFPENQYLLFNPKKRQSRSIYHSSYEEINPSGLWKKAPSLWRSLKLGAESATKGVDIFHGLSHDLSLGLSKKKFKKIVTIHDLIFVRFPKLYPYIERKLHIAKTKYSSKNSDLIIAISQQTKKDLIQYYGIPEKKIKVVYQPCNPIFGEEINTTIQKEIQRKYRLPTPFFLHVGRIEERKNLALIVEALPKGKANLVVVGRPTGYAKKYHQKVKSIIDKRGISSQVYFIENVPLRDLVGIYQMALALIYPSFFEGFGIPILEAFHSKTLVISSHTSCLREVGEDAALYIAPESREDLEHSINEVLYMSDEERTERIERGLRVSENFSPKKIATDLMQCYEI